MRKKLLIIYSFVMFLSGTGASQAQRSDIPLTNPLSHEILNFHDERATNFVANNLNRFAYEKLLTYDKLLDSLYKKELSDTLGIIDQNYLSESAKQKSVIDEHRIKIEELKKNNAEQEDSYWAFIKKALLSFTLWLIIILLLIQMRKRGLRNRSSQVSVASEKLKLIEENAEKSQKLFSDYGKLLPFLEKLSAESSRLSVTTVSSGNETNTPADWKLIVQKSDLLKRGTETEKGVCEAVVLQAREPDDEKQDSDINVLCDQYLEIAYRGVYHPETFNVQVARDFEKKLPSIKLNHSAVGCLLLNVLMNAFESVKIKHDQGTKGYQPKVSMSTRILPRFLQIRIRDNGIGMNDNILQKIFDEFYTDFPDSGAGLGLSISKTIISELHKGEIKIESEEGSSTDVYIKFFI